MLQVPSRRPGSGRKKSYGAREVGIIRRALAKNNRLTCLQLKGLYPKTIGKLARRTVNKILHEDLGYTIGKSVMARKPLLTNEKKEKRKQWATERRNWDKKWGRYLFADEKIWWTRAETGGRLCWRLPGSNRFDPAYTVSDYHHPEKLLWWAGVTTSGKKISRWLGPNETMNSENFVRSMRSAGVPKFLKKHKLKLLQDNAPPHTSAPTKDFMTKEKMKVEFTPPTSPDFMVVENLFGMMTTRLADKPMRNLEELKLEVNRCWKGISKKDISEAFEDMKDRMEEAIEFDGNMTSY